MSIYKNKISRLVTRSQNRISSPCKRWDTPELQPVKTLEAIQNPHCDYRYTAMSDDFKKIPGSPIAYWASPKLLEAFEDGISLGNLGRISEGVKTGDNNKFLRLWFEVDHSLFAINAHAEDIESLSKEKRWFPHHKGGDYRRWYGNFEYVIEWQNNGEKLKAAPNSGFQGRENYFKSGITWAKLSSSHFGVRYLPEGVLFDSGSPAFFPKSKEYLQPFLAYLSSKLASRIIKSLNPTLNFQVGNVASLPILLSQMQRNLERLKHIPRDCIAPDYSVS